MDRHGQASRSRASIATTNTFEQIVLSGSRVRLACPQTISILPNAPLPPKDRSTNSTSDREPQTIAAVDSNLSPADSSRTTSAISGEQVKWFRNHVPLIHRTQQHEKLQEPSSDGSPPWFDVADAEDDSRAAPKMLPKESEAGLYLNESNSPGSGGHTTREFSSGGDNSENENIFSDFFQEPTSLSSPFDLGERSTNVNEPKEGRKRFNSPEELTSSNNKISVAILVERAAPPTGSSRSEHENDNFVDNDGWYINNYGELVIEEVSKDSSGKYTCLYGGRQSELLLDVFKLDTRQSENNSVNETITRSQNGMSEGHRTARTSDAGGTSFVSQAESSDSTITDNNEQQASDNTPGSDSLLSKVDDSSGNGNGDSSSSGIFGGNFSQDCEDGAGCSRAGRINESLVSALMPPSLSEATMRPVAPTTAETAPVAAETLAKQTPRPDLSEEITISTESTQFRPGSESAKERVHLINGSLTPFEDSHLSSQQVSNLIIGPSLQASPMLPSPSTLASIAVDQQQANSGVAQQQQLANYPSASDKKSNDFNDNKIDLLEYSNRNEERATKSRAHLMRSKGRRRQIHLVESETITAPDLRTIPGLLYTKQQFHCPAPRQVDLFALLIEHIQPLVREFCPPSPSLDSSPSSTMRGYNETVSSNCRQLAERLILQVAKSACINGNGGYGDGVSGIGIGGQGYRGRESRTDQICVVGAQSVMDVVWFKDGKQLQFTADGREAHARFNIKLIDLFDQFKASARIAESGASGAGNSESAKSDGSMPFNPERAPPSTRHLATPDLGLDLTAKNQNNNRGPQQQRQPLQRDPQRADISGKWPACPLRGLTLEIDGVRKDNAGRYTCALKLSISKLDKTLKSLRQLNERRQLSDSIGWPNCVHDKDDISCCNHEQTRESKTTEVAAALQPKAPITKTDATKLASPEGKFASSIVTEQQSKLEAGGTFKNEGQLREQIVYEKSQADRITENEFNASASSVTGSGSGDDGAGRQAAGLLTEHSSVAILESILNGSLPSERSLAYIEQTMTKVAPVLPLTMLQTFVMAVVERSEADSAYSRRKLADFKRLKRSLANRHRDRHQQDQPLRQRQSQPQWQQQWYQPPLKASQSTAATAIDGTIGRLSPLSVVEMGPTGGFAESANANPRGRSTLFADKSSPTARLNYHQASDDRLMTSRSPADNMVLRKGAKIVSLEYASQAHTGRDSVQGRPTTITREQRELQQQQSALFAGPRASASTGGDHLREKREAHSLRGAVDAEAALPISQQTNYQRQQALPIGAVQYYYQRTGTSHSHAPHFTRTITTATTASGHSMAVAPLTVVEDNRENTSGTVRQLQVVGGPNLLLNNATELSSIKGTRFSGTFAEPIGRNGGNGSVDKCANGGGGDCLTTMQSNTAVNLQYRPDDHHQTKGPIHLIVKSTHATGPAAAIATAEPEAPFNYANERNSKPRSDATHDSIAARASRDRPPPPPPLALSTVSDSSSSSPASNLSPVTAGSSVGAPPMGPPAATKDGGLASNGGATSGTSINNAGWRRHHFMSGPPAPPPSVAGEERTPEGILGQAWTSAVRSAEAPLGATMPNDSLVTTTTMLAMKWEGKGELSAPIKSNLNDYSGSRRFRATEETKDLLANADSHMISGATTHHEVSLLAQQRFAPPPSSRQPPPLLLLTNHRRSQLQPPLASEQTPSSSEFRGSVIDGNSAAAATPPESSAPIQRFRRIRRAAISVAATKDAEDDDEQGLQLASFESNQIEPLASATLASVDGTSLLERRIAASGQHRQQQEQQQSDIFASTADQRLTEVEGGNSNSDTSDDYVDVDEGGRPGAISVISGQRHDPSYGHKLRHRYRRSHRPSHSYTLKFSSSANSNEQGHLKTRYKAADRALQSDILAPGDHVGLPPTLESRHVAPQLVNDFRSLPVSFSSKSNFNHASSAFDETGRRSEQTTNNGGGAANAGGYPPTIATTQQSASPTNGAFGDSRLEDPLIASANDRNGGGSFISRQAADGALVGSDNEDDESLLLVAGRYLYMHMKAYAASSMYGVQVDVEWSNERVNGTNIEFTSGGDGGGIGDENLRVNRASRLKGPDDGTSSSIASIRRQAAEGGELNSRKGAHSRPLTEPQVTVPFATIDLVAGQNLHLQCTAQALGRLPEIKWYKRISSVPAHLQGFASVLLRKIGEDLYWPVTELDLLVEAADSFDSIKRTPEDHSPSSMGFVCSQSITIFDNLLNQTFTVINSLQLSQQQPEQQHRQSDALSSAAPFDDYAEQDGSSYNLYACIVDADVRHNYATLGVHSRETTGKLVFGSRKNRMHRRLDNTDDKKVANSNLLVSHQQPVWAATTAAATAADSRHNRVVDEPDQLVVDFDFLRQSHLQFPMHDQWIPIRNGSVLGVPDIDEYAMNSIPTTPAILSAIIIFVFSTLLALVYLTLRSYHSLTSFDMETDDDENTLSGPQQPPMMKYLSSSLDSGNNHLKMDNNISSPATAIDHLVDDCACQLGAMSGSTQPTVDGILPANVCDFGLRRGSVAERAAPLVTTYLGPQHSSLSLGRQTFSLVGKTVSLDQQKEQSLLGQYCALFSSADELDYPVCYKECTNNAARQTMPVKNPSNEMFEKFGQYFNRQATTSTQQSCSSVNNIEAHSAQPVHMVENPLNAMTDIDDHAEQSDECEELIEISYVGFEPK